MRELAGGPLATEPGVYWLEVSETELDCVAEVASRLGYTTSIHVPRQARSGIRWRRRTWKLETVWEADAEAFRADAPDRRPFTLIGDDGSLRRVVGYRGSGADGQRRALPVEDARMLANLAGRGAGCILDPFAGGGGVVWAARSAGLPIACCDIDQRLRVGLADVSRLCCIADVRHLPFLAGAFAAVATEPPYDEASTAVVVSSIAELHRVVVSGGRILLLPATRQASLIRDAAERLGWASTLDEVVDRKGTAVVVQRWVRP